MNLLSKIPKCARDYSEPLIINENHTNIIINTLEK